MCQPFRHSNSNHRNRLLKFRNQVSKQSSLPDTEPPASQAEIQQTQLRQAEQWEMHCTYCAKRQQIVTVGVSNAMLPSESGSELCFETELISKCERAGFMIAGKRNYEVLIQYLVVS